MREHGINTTKADYWVHLFPRSARIYWYRADQCRAYFARLSLYEHNGTSADGSVTGRGKLLPKDMYFVQSAEVPEKYLKHYNWWKDTDREFGLWGQLVVEALIEHRIITFPILHCSAMRDRQSQFDCMDYRGEWMKPITVEVKTERHDESLNLFVQTEEGGHKVHLLRCAGGTVERITAAPEFSDDVPF